MPILNIDTMKTMLIGVSFMKGTQAKLLSKVWTERFTGNTLKAVLVENNEKIEDVYDNICDKLQELGIEEVDSRVMVAVFLDFTDTDQAVLSAKIDNLQADIEDLLAQEIFEFFIFNHVGAYRREFRGSDARQELRNQIERSIYNNKRTFLVGRNPLAREEESWKGEVALLDVVSRGGNEANSYFLNGTFGFLRYRDSNQDIRNKYVHRLEQLNRLLSDHGEDEFRNNLKKYMEEHLQQPIAEIYKPVPGVYPVPDKLLSRPGWSKNEKEIYDECVSKTMVALCETAKKMEDEMQIFYKELAVNINNIVNELMEQSEVGIELMQDRQAGNRIFSLGQNITSDARISLNGKYSLEELQTEIKKFLDNMYKQALCSVCTDFINAVREAYEAITPEKIQELKQQYENERAIIVERLKKLPDMDSFCSEVLKNEHFDSAFRPRNANLPARENKALLFSGDEMYERLKRDGYYNNIQPFYYEQVSGFESAEALSTFLYTNVDEQIKDILKELIVD